MRPEGKDAAYLWDILQAAQRIEAFTEDVARKDFERDEKTYYAVIAQLQIIGEAVKRLSDALRESHPSIPWRDMARMRDWLIHHYDEVNYDILWETIQEDIPKLIEYLNPLLGD